MKKNKIANNNKPINKSMSGEAVAIGVVDSK